MYQKTLERQTARMTSAFGRSLVPAGEVLSNAADAFSVFPREMGKLLVDPVMDAFSLLCRGRRCRPSPVYQRQTHPEL